MKFFLLLAVFAVFGYAGANCGCLKCSKHLCVIGEIPGAPGQPPIKVISRCPPAGFPVDDTFGPLQPTVQVPVPKPEPVPVCGGAKFPITVKHFYKPYCADGCYFGSGSIHGPGAAHNPCTDARHVYDYPEYYGPIVPVKVQVPVPEKPEDKKCITLQGLQTAVDRIIIPSPGFCPGEGPFNVYGPYGHGCHGHYHHHQGCSPCHHRYDSQSQNLVDKNVKERRKRELLQNGYKFFINMLPPFIQEPIKDTVNRMAITHPDKKLRKIYNLPPPPLTLKEKIEMKHQEIKNKLFGNTVKSSEPLRNVYDNKNNGYNIKSGKNGKIYIDDKVVEQEAEDFIDSLLVPEQKKSFVNNRAKSALLNKKLSDKSWFEEFKTKDAFSKLSKQLKKKKLTQQEKSLLLQKLKKLNQGTKRSKRDVPAYSESKSKRSIIIGSDELDLPLYQIKIEDSDEDNSQDFEDNESGFDDSDYNDVDDEDYDENKYGSSKEELIRYIIKEELQKFKQVQSDEELVGAPVALHQKDDLGSKFPLLRILSFPMKFLKKIKNNEEIPIVGDVPKMLIGTKKYIKDFGKNFKKNFLHFTSDMIGDFDNYGSTHNVLANIAKSGRFRRSIQSEDSLNMQNFINDSNLKVRDKRYILKTVDDDEIEELLRQKLGKLLDDSPKKKHKKKNHSRPKKYHNERSEEHKEHHRKKPKKHSYNSSETYKKRGKSDPKLMMKKNQDNSIESTKPKIFIEPIKPKVIIDNNGLPFMEVNGYKRPLFIKNIAKEALKRHHSEEKASVEHNESSSEEVNLAKIHDLIDNAKNYKNIYTRNLEAPLETLKDKISQLLHDIDTLVHMDFEKYDDIYDDLIELQSVCTSIVQSWKRIIMDKKINDYDAKINLLEKFEQLQELKSKTMESIIYVMKEDCENGFALRKIVDALMRLHKIQCVIDQVVTCFQEKFKTGSKFEMKKEIKFVDFLASLKFVRATTRNDLICMLKEERDQELQEYITLLEKLKKLLVEGDDALIEEEANVLWEMRHVQKMQLSTIEEMYERLEEGLKIKKNMKILFDLSTRLKNLHEKEKSICSGQLEETEKSESKEVEEKDEKKLKKIDIEDFKAKWEERLQKHRELTEENFKKRMSKIKKLKELRKKIKSVEEKDKSPEDDDEDD